MFRKTVTTFLRIKVGGHFVMSIVKCYESHYVGVLDNPRTHGEANAEAVCPGLTPLIKTLGLMLSAGMMVGYTD